MLKAEFKAKGYLEKTYLDKDGAKHATFEFSIKDAVEIAKLELMARDLKNHLPILLEINVKQSQEKTESKSAGGKAPAVCNARGVTRKDKRVF